VSGSNLRCGPELVQIQIRDYAVLDGFESGFSQGLTPAIFA